MGLVKDPSYHCLREITRMPWSADENREWMLAHIKPTDRILDVGAGAGIWSDLLRSKGVPLERIDAVEIFEPYIERFGLKNKYNEIFLGDFKELAIPHKYDIVILGDVLEHFEMSNALEVWEKARRLVGSFGKVLLSTPIIDFPQGEEEGNIHEAHLSSFDMESLRGLSGVSEWVEGTIIGSITADGSPRPSADDLTVVVTTIPTREDRLAKALESVMSQSLAPAAIVVQLDVDRLGAPGNRDSGLEKVKTKYVAFLDDDDYFYPDHLEKLYSAAVENDADIVYSWFDVEGGTDPFPENFGKPWDPDNPVQTTVTTLCKADTVRKSGGFSNTYRMSEDEISSFAQGNTAGEDFRMVYNANKQGAKIVHVPERTWIYVHWEKNTSGQPDRW